MFNLFSNLPTFDDLNSWNHYTEMFRQFEDVGLKAKVKCCLCRPEWQEILQLKVKLHCFNVRNLPSSD